MFDIECVCYSVEFNVLCLIVTDKRFSHINKKPWQYMIPKFKRALKSKGKSDHVIVCKNMKSLLCLR